MARPSVETMAGLLDDVIPQPGSIPAPQLHSRPRRIFTFHSDTSPAPFVGFNCNDPPLHHPLSLKVRAAPDVAHRSPRRRRDLFFGFLHRFNDLRARRAAPLVLEETVFTGSRPGLDMLGLNAGRGDHDDINTAVDNTYYASSGDRRSCERPLIHCSFTGFPIWWDLVFAASPWPELT